MDKKEKQMQKECPWNCGICPQHKTNTIIGIIIATNRCNLNCPVCLANAGVSSFLYEPSFNEIKTMLQFFKNNKFTFPTIAFSGGEPTLRDDIPELLAMTQGEGFDRTEVITNGIRLAEDFDYVKALRKVNLSQLGLQFDGLEEDIYIKLRGRPLLQTKLKAFENLKRVKQPVILAVTLARGINAHQIGKIIKFAIQNKEIVEHINFQLIAFSGRAINFNVENHKMSFEAFLKMTEVQTNGLIKQTDFYPPDYIAPVPEFIELFTGVPQVKFFPHPACDIATYLLIDKKKGKIVPLNRLFNLFRFLELFKQGIEDLKKSKGIKRFFKKTLIIFNLLKIVLPLLRISMFRNLFLRAFRKKSYDPLADLKEVLMISCTQYMSIFDFNKTQAKRCVIHYIFKDDKVVPFCNYNVLHITEKANEFGRIFL